MPPGYSAVERRLVGVPTGRMGFDEEASGGRGVCGGGTDWCAERGVGGTDQRTQHRNTRSSCEDNTVRVVIKPDGGASGWDVDAQRELTGVRYFASSLDARFYFGELDTEPTDVDPVFTVAKEWGNRTGHEGTVVCSASETFIGETQVFTGFFDLTVTQQDKGN
jgi:hypothetical protein